MVSNIGQVDKLGCFVFADGDRYDGHFRRGAMHGYGVYYWANDRATYFGKWDDNAQSGCGVKFYGNGGVEFGEWKDDQYLGQYTGVCGQQESYAAMNNAVDVAQRARMFKYKPDSEVTLQRRPFTMHQDPVVYQSGTEWTMPGWRGEQYPAPSAEELEEDHPRLYAQMQRHNEIWERAWRYYNLDLKDAQAFGVEKKARDLAEAEARALARDDARQKIEEAALASASVGATGRDDWWAFLGGSGGYPGRATRQVRELAAKGTENATETSISIGDDTSSPELAWAHVLRARSFDGAMRARVASLRVRLRTCVAKAETSRFKADRVIGAASG